MTKSKITEIEWKVEGMSCNNCAANVSKYLKSQGLEDVDVNFATKEVRFKGAASPNRLINLKEGISNLGYQVVDQDEPPARTSWWDNLLFKVIFSAIFTAPLLIHHLLMLAGTGLPLVDRPEIQLALCLPVFIIGTLHFGRSSYYSLRGGILNMDVLIFLGSSAAFIYSLIGLIIHEPNYIFFETAATIITLVLLGNWMEHRAVRQTTTAIEELTALQVEKANRLLPGGSIQSVPVEQLRVGDRLQVNEGDKIPTDGSILEGEVVVDESMITGESIPVEKSVGQSVTGATIVVSGNCRMQVTAVGKQTVLSQIIDLVKQAQQNKPNIQRLADQISAVFVPIVIGISLFAVGLGYWVLGFSLPQAVMNGIAVLVVSCPCAMGLATPTAVMVGVGRLAKQGILVKGGQTIELLAKIKNYIFDKTGTLTDGELKIADVVYFDEQAERTNALLVEMEKHSSHPIAVAVVEALANRNGNPQIDLQEVVEHKGRGLTAIDREGNQFRLGTPKFHSKSFDVDGDILLTQNDELLATIKLADNIREEAVEVTRFLSDQSTRTILLSGDREEKVKAVAEELGIDTYYAERLPDQKLEIVRELSAKEPTAMVGDGINDAPALTEATIGISLGNASHAAIRSAQVILLNDRIGQLKHALMIGKHTVLTIKQNLFWAFAYNIVAIPVAVMGGLHPMLGALFMALSDVVVIGNSIRLKYKRI